MAHGFSCKRCGFQETPHTMPSHYPGVCEAYISPDPKTEAGLWALEQERDADRESYKYRGPAYDH